MVYGFQLKDIKIKNILPTLIVVIIFVWIIWYIFVKKGSSKKNNLKNINPVPAPVNSSNTVNKTDEQNYANQVGNSKKLPNYYNMTLKIDVEGRKNVFPFTLVKVTQGPIELPNRRSLVDKSAKYKYIDVMPGEKINIVALINLSYTVDHFAFNDDFLVTDKDYLIAYSQAVKEFELA